MSQKKTVSQIVKVHQVIDLFVLSYLVKGKSYLLELDEQFERTFGYRVSTSYMNRRLLHLSESGYVYMYWDDEHKRTKHNIEITSEGRKHFYKILPDVQYDLVELNAFIRATQNFLKPYDKVNPREEGMSL